MTNERIQLEFVLDKLREIATINPEQLAMYIAESNALLRIASMNFSEEDIIWFNEQTESIVEVYLGGRLFRDGEYGSYRESLS